MVEVIDNIKKRAIVEVKMSRATGDCRTLAYVYGLKLVITDQYFVYILYINYPLIDHCIRIYTDT